MKKALSFLLIFIVSLGLIIQPLRIYADDLIISGSDSYLPSISTDDFWSDIGVPAIIGNILETGGQIAFNAFAGGYAELVDLVIDNLDDMTWNDVYNEIFRRSPLNNGIIKWNEGDADANVQTWQQLAGKMADSLITQSKLHDRIQFQEPEPDPNYGEYIARINDRSTFGNYVGKDFYWKNNYFINTGNNYGVYFLDNPNNYSYILTQLNANAISSGINETRRMIASQPITIYIIGQDNTWSYSSSAWSNVTNQITQRKSGSAPYYAIMGGVLSGLYMDAVYSDTPNNDIPLQSRLSGTGSSLTEIFDKLYWYFRNVNIYVNGLPWAIVTNNESNVYISENTYITGTDSPIRYELPANTNLDLTKLKNYIISAINDSLTLKYNDISDVFIDVNGQEAVAVVQVLRSDYDNMYNELYPFDYPKFEIDTRFYTDMQIGADIIDNSVSVIPNDLLQVLVYGGCLILFAFVVKKLIE